MTSEIKSQIFAFVKNYLNKTSQKMSDLEIQSNFQMSYQHLSFDRLQLYLERLLRAVPEKPPFGSNSIPGLYSFGPNRPILGAHPRPAQKLGSLPELVSYSTDNPILGKRGHLGFRHQAPARSPVKINVQLMPNRAKKLNVQKIQCEFEDLMSKVTLDTGSKVKVNFQTSSPTNSIYVSNSLHSETLSLKTGLLSQDGWDRRPVLDSKPESAVQEPPRLEPAPEPRATGPDACVESLIQNTYFGNVEEEVASRRKETIRKLLSNIKNTFQFENNLTTTVKNLITFENLQIRVPSEVFEKIPFQAKVTVVVRYWFQLVSFKWFRANFAEVMPSVQVAKSSFVAQITKS